MQLEGIDIDINKLPAEARKEFLRYKIKLEEKRKESAIRNDFMSFVKYVWPDFIEGSHHKIMAEKFKNYSSDPHHRARGPLWTKSETLN